MKKILIPLLVLTMCFSFVACGKEDSKTTAKAYFSLEELLGDPEFQKLFSDNEDENFKTSVSAGGSDVMVFRVDAKKTYTDESDLDFFRNLTTEEISDKFGLAELQKLLKRYGFGNVTIEYKMYNGDGTLITERTLS